MMYISIDLSQRSTGVTIYDNKDNVYGTFTITNLLETKYKECDIEQIKLAVNKLLIEIMNKLSIEFERSLLTIIIEYNVNPMNVRFEKFSLSFIFYLASFLDKFKIVPIQASRWMKVANEIFSIKRDKYANNKEGNKKWISDLCKHLLPNHNFKTQDEKDSFLMLKTYLEKPNRF